MPPRELAATMRAMPTQALALAALLTFLNYLILTGYDQLAFVYIRRPIARWQIAMASFVGYAIANNVGFALLSGTSARYRFYSRWGLSGEDISRVVLFYSSTYWLGLNVVGGWALAGGEIQGIDAYVPAAAGTPDGVVVSPQRACVSAVRAGAEDADLRGGRAHRAAVDGAGGIAVPALDARLGPRLGRAVRAGAGPTTRLPLFPRCVPGRAAGGAHQPRAWGPGCVRVADGAAAGSAGRQGAASPGVVSRDLLPRATGRGATRPDRRRDLAATPPGGAVG